MIKWAIKGQCPLTIKTQVAGRVGVVVIVVVHSQIVKSGHKIYAVYLLLFYAHGSFMLHGVCFILEFYLYCERL